MLQEDNTYINHIAHNRVDLIPHGSKRLAAGSTIDGEWEEGTHELGSDPKAILHVHDYDPITYIEDLDWALEYWRGNRDPIPTTKPAKCRACVYNDICDDSKA
ncbi:hypothetical protein GCM10025298_07430 [Natronobiforma cellulositropha]